MAHLKHLILRQLIVFIAIIFLDDKISAVSEKWMASSSEQKFSNWSRDTNSELFLGHALINKLAEFNRERIPPRGVHAKGHGAFGSFVVTHNVSTWTKADVFNVIGKVTPIFVRFSFTGMEEGESETTAGSRGFAIKFYTQDGNLDFPGLQIPAFPIRDAADFPELAHSIKRHPVSHLRNGTDLHDLFSRRPEMTNFYLRLYSDMIRIRSSRGINASAVNTYECINSYGDVVYCKFSWQSWQNMDWLRDEEIIHASGTEPEFYARDLLESIRDGNFPKWTFGMQVMTFDEAESLAFDPFDVTRVWGVKEFPFIPIGDFVLNKNPADHFSEVEQAAFCPNFVPGIGPSPDKVLLARTFAYKDAQRYRLGPNFEQLKVNRPLPGVKSHELVDTKLFPLSRVQPRKDWDEDKRNFEQPRQYLANMDKDEIGRIAIRIRKKFATLEPEHVRNRVLKNCIEPLGKELMEMIFSEV